MPPPQPPLTASASLLANGVKRPGDDALDASEPAGKAARTEVPLSASASALDAASMRRKPVGSSRTGQACDRCKIRKIRCDARPGGCSPCMQNQTECKTTDRITGRATSRGHTENLENENTTLRLYMIELQAQLKEHGIDPRPAPVIAATQTSRMSNSPPYVPNPAWDSQQTSTVHATAKSDGPAAPTAMLPEFRPGCIGDNYLGVVSGNNGLSPIEGTSLSLFGTKIDLADFMPQEASADVVAMSYQTFLDFAFGRRSAGPPPQLPDYDSCKVFADWYFRSITPFVPILHKPDFMQLLDRIYLENHLPTPAESVMVHMMLALMNFQWSARNKSEQSRKQSFEHYHYSLTFIPQLIAGHELADLQALALICAQLRNQPRSGAAWWFTDLVLGLAIESGLHRSVKAWQKSEFTPHVVEMRKRVFWSLLGIHVSMSGKLGRPMPLRLEDFDVELPEPLPDHLPGENLPKWKRCSFRAGIQGMKMLKILMGVFSTIYSVRSTSGPYEVHVRQLEKDLEAFKAQLPPELSGGPQTREEERVYALYLQMTIAEIQLLLHHPSLCRSQSAQTVSANLDVCLAATSTLLSGATQLKQLKSLDTTWYWTMDFLAAIFTTLFAHHERRDELTLADMQKLKQDMVAWLDVMGEVGQLLGTGPRLQNAVGAIVEHSLKNVSAHITAKTASAAIASSDHPSSMQNSAADQSYSDDTDYAVEFVDDNPKAQNARDTHVLNPRPEQASQHASSFMETGYNFNPTRNTGLSTFPHLDSFDASSYSPDELKPTLDAQLNAIPPPQGLSAQGSHAGMPGSSAFMGAFQQPVPSQPAFAPSANAGMMSMEAYRQIGGSAAWRHFTDNVMMNLAGQDYLSSTSALMSLGNVPQDININGMPMTLPMQMAANPSNPLAQQGWPFIQYASGP